MVIAGSAAIATVASTLGHAIAPGLYRSASDYALPDLSASQQIRFLNEQRARHGIPSDLVEVPEWTEGCRQHMAYLERHDLFQHEQDPEDHPEGSTAEGDAAGRGSVLTPSGSAFNAEGLNDFEHAPLHLAQMLNPWTTRTGAADGCLATFRDVTRTFVGPATYVYPGDGGSTFPEEIALEDPFVPGDFVGLPMGTRTGPHLYFFYAGPTGFHGSYGRIEHAELTGPGGAQEVRTVDNHTRDMGRRIPPGGIVIPVKPLRKGATYTATVRFQPDHAPVVIRSWQFRTTLDCPPPGASC